MAAQLQYLPILSFWGQRTCQTPGIKFVIFFLAKFNEQFIVEKENRRTDQIERITVIITLIYLAFYRSLWTILKSTSLLHHVSLTVVKVGNEYVNSLNIGILQGFQNNHSPKNLAVSILFLTQWYIHSDGNLSSQISTTFWKNQWWLAN